jgi:hypothetical protein
LQMQISFLPFSRKAYSFSLIADAI